MTEKESLILRNILNGLDPRQVAEAVHEEESVVMGAFQEAMRRVSEYVLVHCVAFFPCGSLVEARQHRLAIIDVLGKVEKWDAVDREIAMNMLKGRDVVAMGVPREMAEQILNQTLNALPHYLTEKDVAPYAASRRDFVRNNRSRVLGAVEKFVSFREPLLYKKIEHLTISME